MHGHVQTRFVFEGRFHPSSPRDYHSRLRLYIFSVITIYCAETSPRQVYLEAVGARALSTTQKWRFPCQTVPHRYNNLELYRPTPISGITYGSFSVSLQWSREDTLYSLVKIVDFRLKDAHLFALPTTPLYPAPCNVDFDESTAGEGGLVGYEGAKVQSILRDFRCHILLYPGLEDYLAVIRLTSRYGMDMCPPLQR